MNIMLIIVSLVLFLCSVSGLIAGFLKKASGLLSFILAGMLVTALLPTVTGWLRNDTPLYGLIREQCAAAAGEIAKNTIAGTFSSSSGETGSGSASDQLPSSSSGSPSSGNGAFYNADGSVDRAAVKSMLNQYGYDSSAIDNLSDDQIKALIAQYAGISAGVLCAGEAPLLILDFPGNVPGILQRWNISRSEALLTTADDAAGSTSDRQNQGAAPESEKLKALSALMGNMTAADKRKFIESLPIPQYLQEQMETFNNSEGYRKLGADDFASYIVNYFASLILNVAAYIVTLLIAWGLIRLVIGAAGIFSRLPIIRTANHALGLGAGILQGLLIVWMLMMVLSFFAATPAGENLMAQVYDNPFLELLYNTNPLMKGASSALKGIM
ncbi:MAG: CvpA family protein [Porcincola intestinalis]|uniref:CvpA family protein n=1 Tax=Porcincola intestinalis TaxID=2606632 RepID=UPI0029D9FD53|nr:CvpA family protein [Porcincola intestinalis]MCI6239267.1 CvpA family protein [Lachnospiraceae bacterium]MDY5331216.1 CvpA family protein [Porcincola intestinalis]